MNNRQIAHNWANKVNTHGKGSNFYYENNIIYSYGSHFPIAKHYNDNVILLTSNGYSSTTAKHISYTRGAIPYDKKVLTVPEVLTPDHANNIYYLCNEIHETFKKALRSHKYFTMHKERVERLQNDLAFLCLNFTIKHNALINEALEIGFSDKQIEQAKKKQKAESQAKKERKEKERKEAIKEFRNFKRSTISSSITPFVCLRRKGDIIETSQGAQVEYATAKRFYDRLKRNEAQKGERLEHYTFLSNNNGIITIGCHKIKMSEASMLF